MKKFLSLLWVIGFIVQATEFNSQDNHPLLSAVRILSFYPFYGANDELCMKQEKVLQEIIEYLIKQQDTPALEIIYFIVMQINDLQDYYFLEHISDDIIDYFCTLPHQAQKMIYRHIHDFYKKERPC